VAPSSAASTASATPFATSLADRSMTVALHLRMWKGQRIDRRVTNEVLNQRGAAADAGRFEKHLVPPASLAAVNQAHSRARARHNSLTLPWGDEGVRILSSRAYFDYASAMQEEQVNCEDAHREFCREYPRLLAMAPMRLGTDLFSGADFPSETQIASKFGFELVTLPVPSAGDFRVELGADVEARIKQDIERTVTSRYADAQRDLWERLQDVLRHFVATMGQSDKVFRNTTVTKLTDLAKVAPKLSLQQDPKLEALCAEVLTITQGTVPDDFRKSEALRTESADKARAALKKIESALAGAF
jgi:hypothetical protein